MPPRGAIGRWFNLYGGVYMRDYLRKRVAELRSTPSPKDTAPSWGRGFGPHLAEKDLFRRFHLVSLNPFFSVGILKSTTRYVLGLVAFFFPLSLSLRVS